MTALERLIHAAQSNDLDTARLILNSNHGVVNEKDASGATAIHYAALGGHPRIVKLLVECGADINVRDDEFGATPAGWAIKYLRELGGHLAIELEDLRH
jgi:ankyrin repeat protein